MSSSEESACELMAQEFGGRIRACQQLLAFVNERLCELPTWEVTHDADGLILAESARSMKTANAALLLCRHGYGDQAAVLCRVLFEAMAIVHWVHASPDDAVERFGRHATHTRIVFDRARRDAGSEPASVGLDHDLDFVRELDKTFGRYGERLWTGHRSIHQLVADIQHQWATPQSQKELLWFLNEPQRYQDKLVHSTAFSLSSTAHTEHTGRVVFTGGPGPGLVGPALHSIHWTIANTYTLVSDHFDVHRRSDFDSLYTRNLPAFVDLPQSATQGVSRNDSCPCGSGRKFKRCHGA